MPRAKSKTNLCASERAKRVSELVKVLESGRRLDWFYIARRYNIARENAYRWLRRARAAFDAAHAPVEPTAVALAAAGASVGVWGEALPKVVHRAA